MTVSPNGQPDLPHERHESVAPDGRPAVEQPAWRRDFPIDWPQDHYVARRDFTKFLGLTSLAFVVGQFWIGVKSLRDRLRGRPPEMPVARLDDIPVGGAVVFHYPRAEDPCLLLRPDDRRRCWPMTRSARTYPARSCRKLIGAASPAHATTACFDLATGRPIAGPPRRPLPRVTLRGPRRRGVRHRHGGEA